MTDEKEKKYLVTSKNCPSCPTVKEKLKDALESGEIEEIIIDTKEDVDLALKMGVAAVPTLLKCVIKDKKMTCKEIDVDEFVDDKKKEDVEEEADESVDTEE
ncbi:MAG: thioredoxin family protein [bacterium]